MIYYQQLTAHSIPAIFYLPLPAAYFLPGLPRVDSNHLLVNYLRILL